MLRFLLLLMCALTSGQSDDVSPMTVAQKVADKIYMNKEVFYIWRYQGAIIFDGLFMSDEVFHLNYSAILDSYLDKWITDKDSDGYKLINNEDIPLGRAVGDTISLFPINYLNRLLREHTNPPTFNTTAYELLLKNDVLKYLLNWPYRLKDGTFSRHTGWEGQPDDNASFVWADDQYMGLTLLSRLSIAKNDLELARGVAQMALQYAKFLKDPQDGLFFHGYNAATGMQSCCKWGRGNGWGLMSHIEVLNAVANFPELAKTSLLDELKMVFNSHVQAMIRHQSLDGRWHQLVDIPSTFLETSGTSMAVYALARGLVQNWLEPTPEIKAAVQKGWNGLLKAIDMKDGTVNAICTGTGIGTNVSYYQDRPTQYVLSGPGLGSVLYATNYVELYNRKLAGQSMDKL